MATKKTPKQRLFLQTPVGYLVRAVLIYLVGWALFLQALDSGSLLHWFGVIIAAVLGTDHAVRAAIMSTKRFIKK